MLDLIYDKLFDQQFIASLLAAVAAGATLLTILMPFLETDTLGRRMKQVSTEREKIRARERERLAKSGRASLQARGQALHVADRGWVLRHEVARHRECQAEARHGGLSRAERRSVVPVLSPHLPGHRLLLGPGLCFGLRQSRSRHRLQGRHPAGRRVPRHQGAGNLSVEHHLPNGRRWCEWPSPTRSISS